jgi:hypothetical protein
VRRNSSSRAIQNVTEGGTYGPPDGEYGLGVTGLDAAASRGGNAGAELVQAPTQGVRISAQERALQAARWLPFRKAKRAAAAATLSSANA